ncbi:hypothetical protein EDEG_03798, partial [Edhazardia aedis USNM 41457]
MTDNDADKNKNEENTENDLNDKSLKKECPTRLVCGDVVFKENETGFFKNNSSFELVSSKKLGGLENTDKPVVVLKTSKESNDDKEIKKIEEEKTLQKQKKDFDRKRLVL